MKKILKALIFAIAFASLLFVSCSSDSSDSNGSNEEGKTPTTASDASTTQNTTKSTIQSAVETKFSEVETKIAENRSSGTTDYSSYYTGLPIELEQVTDFSVPSTEKNIVTDYSADNTGETLVTDKIQKAIDDLNSAGGGRLIFPEGTYQTGPITLKSNVELHLEKGSVIQSTSDKTQFGTSGVSYLLKANDVENVIISGEGTIDGNGLYWRPLRYSRLEKYKGETDANAYWNELKNQGWYEDTANKVLYPWTNDSTKAGLYNQSLFTDSAAGYSAQSELRGRIFDLTGCTNLKITGVTFKDSPKMHIYLHEVNNLIIDGITINSDPWTENTDAIDFGRGNRMLLVNNYITCGDDGFVVKGGTASTSNPSLTQNVLVRYNRTYYSHCGFGAGSDLVGGMKNIVVIDNAFENSSTGGFRIKNPAGRGGESQEVYFYDNALRNTTLGSGKLIEITESYEDNGVDGSATAGDDNTSYFPKIHNIHFKNINGYSTGKVHAVKLAGLADHEVYDVDFTNCNLVSPQKITIDYARNVSFNECNFFISNSKPKVVTNSSSITFTSSKINGVTQ